MVVVVIEEGIESEVVFSCCILSMRVGAIIKSKIDAIVLNVVILIFFCCGVVVGLVVREF